MARYDRIALLEPPDRGETVPGWSVFRDLDGHERDTGLIRRARLRFLALRPVHRVMRRGVDDAAAASIERQIADVRAELDALAARDTERARLARLLERLPGAATGEAATALLEVGESAEGKRHLHAAEEFYRTALDWAERHGLASGRVAALHSLGRVRARRKRWAEARADFRLAAELALKNDDRPRWREAMAALAAAQRGQGDAVAATRTAERILEQGRAWHDHAAIAYGLGELCLSALEGGDAEGAIAHGWAAAGYVDDAEYLHTILSGLGVAFARLGLDAAAERCHLIVATRSRRRAARTRARLELASVAARSGRVDVARDHLRAAITAAREHGYRRILARAEELLEILEAGTTGMAGHASREPEAASEGAKRIAAEVEAFGAALVPASG